MSTVEQTANSLTIQLSDLEIGGRNYIILNKLNSYTTYNSLPTFSGDTISTTFQSTYPPASDGYSYISLNVDGYTPPKEIMTLSGYIKVNGEIPETNYFVNRLCTYNDNNVIAMTYDNTTGYFVYTQKYSGSSKWIIHGKVNRTSATADVVTFEKLKFEKGSKPTDWTPAPEDVDKNITMASKTATNYMNYSNSGLVIGDMTTGTLGKNVLIDSDSVDIRNGTTTLASFGATDIYLGKNSETSVINLCNGAATMRVKDNTDFRIYTDKRLVMSAYSSMLLDCWRDSTHMTRIAIQSSDPNSTSTVGGVQFTIYQGNIENTVSMLKNNITLKVTNGTSESRVNLDEGIFKVYAANRIRLNSKNPVQIAESSNYSAGLLLGSTFNMGKTISVYWSNGGTYDLVSHSSNGQTSYFGPADIGETTTTNIRGKYVRLYAHEGGGVYLGYSGSTAITSDRNMKKDIIDIDDKYIDFFDRLRPITYKYNVGHRDHIGFVAQEVEEALIASGLTTEQFAGLVIERDINLNPNYDSSLSDEENTANETHYDKLYSLRYEEFISLLVKKVQNLQKQIDELKGE